MLVFHGSHFQFDMTVYGFLSAWLIPGRQAGVLGEDQRREAKLVGSDIDDTRGSADFNLYPVVTVTHWADEDAAVVDAITPPRILAVCSVKRLISVEHRITA